MDLIQSYKEELQLIRKPWTRVWVGAFVLFLILLPWVAPQYITYIATIIFIYSIGVQGQNLLIGYTGQISFGQAGFLAIGAFTFGHLSIHGAPWFLSLLGAGVAAGLFGLVVGFPSLRLKGPYLAIATMGFGIAVYQVFVNSEVLSGGRMGLAVQKLSPLFGLSPITYRYYFNFLMAALFTLASYNIISSYMGRAFIAIRDNDIAAEVLGVNLTRYKLLSFAVSSFYTGVQGALLGLFLGYLGAQHVHLHGIHHPLCGCDHRGAGFGGGIPPRGSLCDSGPPGVQCLQGHGACRLRRDHRVGIDLRAFRALRPMVQDEALFSKLAVPLKTAYPLRENE